PSIRARHVATDRLLEALRRPADEDQARVAVGRDDADARRGAVAPVEAVGRQIFPIAVQDPGPVMADEERPRANETRDARVEPVGADDEARFEETEAAGFDPAHAAASVHPDITSLHAVLDLHAAFPRRVDEDAIQHR